MTPIQVGVACRRLKSKWRVFIEMEWAFVYADLAMLSAAMLVAHKKPPGRQGPTNRQTASCIRTAL